jgi:hypothetical protein
VIAPPRALGLSSRCIATTASWAKALRAMAINLTPRRPSRDYSDGSMSSRKLAPVAFAWSRSPKAAARSHDALLADIQQVGFKPREKPRLAVDLCIQIEFGEGTRHALP